MFLGIAKLLTKKHDARFLLRTKNAFVSFASPKLIGVVVYNKPIAY